MWTSCSMVFLFALGSLGAQVTGTTVMPYFTPSAFNPSYGSNVAAPSSPPYQTTSVQWGGAGQYTPDIVVQHETDPGPPVAVNPWNLGGYSDLPSVIYPAALTQRLRVRFTATAMSAVVINSFALGNFRSSPITVPSVSLKDSMGTIFWQQQMVVLPPSSQTALRLMPGLGSASEWVIEIEFAGMTANRTDVGLSEVSFSQGSTSVAMGQPNRTDASLQINGVGPIGPRGPFSSTVTPGGMFRMDWQGPADSLLFLFADPALAATSVAVGCTGSVDIGNFPAEIPALVFDAYQPGFPGLLFRLDATGHASQIFSVPLVGTTTRVAFQGMVQPVGAGPCGSLPLLTSAHLVTFF